MAVVVVVALIAGMIMAAYLMIMTYLIIYYINKGKKQNLTMPGSATQTIGRVALNGMPPRFIGGCTRDEVGTLRCVIA